MLPLYHDKNFYGSTKAKDTDLHAPCHTINAQNLWAWHLWYKFILLLFSGHLFAS